MCSCVRMRRCGSSAVVRSEAVALRGSCIRLPHLPLRELHTSTVYSAMKALWVSVEPRTAMRTLGPREDAEPGLQLPRLLAASTRVWKNAQALLAGGTASASRQARHPRRALQTRPPRGYSTMNGAMSVATNQSVGYAFEKTDFHVRIIPKPHHIKQGPQ